jgi:hypothetical protein
MKIISIIFEKDRIIGITDDGRELWQSLLYYPRLHLANEDDRLDYSINAFGIHWNKLDEDVSFESFEYSQPEPEGLARFFLLHPEINVSALARRIGMKQSLLAAYINGTKHPSNEQKQRIVTALHEMGKELVSIQL